MRPSERQGGSQRYSRKNARPLWSACSNSHWSSAMFSAPERPIESMESWKVGRSGTPSNLPTFRPSALVSSDGIRFHRGAHAHEIAVPVRPVYAPDRRPHLVLAGRGGGGRRPPPRGGALPPVGGDGLERVGGGCQQVVSGGFAAPLHLPAPLPDRGHR